MRRDPVAIVEEYLLADAAGVRSNAVTALQAIGTARASMLLQEVAKRDRDVMVRESATMALLKVDKPGAVNLLMDLAIARGAGDEPAWALEQLKRMDASTSQAVAEQLNRVLWTEPANSAAYMMLGQLRARDIDVEIPQAGWNHRVHRERALRRFNPTTARRLPRTAAPVVSTTSVMPALRGGVAGMALLIVALMLAELPSAVTAPAASIILASAFVFAPGLAMFATRDAYPWRLQSDRTVGLLLELVNVMRGVIWPVPVAMLMPLALLLVERTPDNSARAALAYLLAATVCTTLVTGAVRAGTLLGAGILPGGVPNRVAQSLVGGVFGVIVMTGCVTLADGFGDYHMITMLQQQWLVMLPIAFGLGSAFAGVDETVPGRRREPTVAQSVAILATVAALGLGFVTVRGEGDLSPTVLPVRELVHRLPTSRTFRVERPGEVVLVVPSQADLGMSLDIQLWRGASMIERQNDPPRIERTLTAGTYRLDVGRLGVAVASGPKGTVFQRLAARAPGRRPSVPSGDTVAPYQLVIEQGSLFQARRLAMVAVQSAMDGSIAGALDLVRRADSLVPGVLSAQQWSEICWHGIRFDSARVVEEACERAVVIDGTDIRFRDGRGLMRALTANVTGAIEDFSTVVEYSSDAAVIDQRQRWISELQAGTHPRRVFTRRVLRSLHQVHVDPVPSGPSP